MTIFADNFSGERSQSLLLLEKVSAKKSQYVIKLQVDMKKYADFKQSYHSRMILSKQYKKLRGPGYGHDRNHTF